MLVLSYAFFAISASPITFLIIRLIYGAAVGIIIVNYFTTVIGDFATKGSKERFYTIGAIIPFIFYLSFDLFSGLLNVPLQTSVISSILMMIFFLSIIPLIYAPETLPANILKKRSIETYIKIAKKKIKK